MREWRFDTATGISCVERTSPEDWKTDIKVQSCVCEDENSAYLGAAEEGASHDTLNGIYATLERDGCMDEVKKLLGKATGGSRPHPPVPK